jgi:mannose-1-phosphate guanylyltransferase
MHNVRRIREDRYAVILAGGSASKLMPLTRRITGRPVPNEELFMYHVDLAMRTANSRRRQLVLLGIKPDRAELGYGWIEPAESFCDKSTAMSQQR